MFGKSVPSRIRSPRSASRSRSPAGNGLNPSLKSVNAIVVSSRTSGYACASARNSPYSGIPMCATISRSRGWRARSCPTGPGPVNRPGAGPDPQCITTGTPASASSPQAGSSSGSLGSYAPTWRCDLKTRAPLSTASFTYTSTPSSGKRVAVCRQSGTRAAKPAAQSLSQRAMPGLCG